jgi:hypothetical protein
MKILTTRNNVRTWATICSVTAIFFHFNALDFSILKRRLTQSSMSVCMCVFLLPRTIDTSEEFSRN